LPSLTEQNSRVRKGEVETNRRGTPDEIINRFYPALNNTGPEEKDKTLYELDEEEDTEVKGDNEEETDDDASLYFRNPKDINFKKSPVFSTNQLKREILTSNDISDLGSFMNQFRR
jgi:hypothetical protein